MSFVESFKDQIFNVNEKTFEDSSLAVFDYQFSTCPIYQQYCKALSKNPTNVHSISDIPFLPIDFFKDFEVKSESWDDQKVFKSSGTTSNQRSKHHIADLEFYHHVTRQIFETFFGSLSQYEILALLPSYLEQGDSSLVSMVKSFFHYSRSNSNFYLDKDISKILPEQSKKVLFGVSYALMDLPSSQSQKTIVIETGGMKGRKKEIIRSELHEIINRNLQPEAIWSEYGMTELLSQAYGEAGKLRFPPWAQVVIREVNDPFTFLEGPKTGGINIIDLANVQTCSFIETKDLGSAKNGYFEVLGRFDNSDIRGCNLLV